MMPSAILLVAVTVLGLCLGLGRELLIVRSWGVGSTTDALLIGLFVPEALRMSLATGVLSTAALPLWAENRDLVARRNWLASQNANMVALAIALAGLCGFAAEPLTAIIGPGLSEMTADVAAGHLRLASMMIPGLVAHAHLAVFLAAKGRFALAGLGSFLFNLPAVLLLSLTGLEAMPRDLILALILGSVVMPLSILPAARTCGWQWPAAMPSGHVMVAFYRRLGLLLTSAGLSHSTALVERALASLFDEGAVTLLNLARKIVNLPSVAILSLGHVVLTRLVGAVDAGDRTLGSVLSEGLRWCTLLTWPAALSLAVVAPALPPLLAIETETAAGMSLVRLIQLFSLPLVVAGWSALLARYFYALGDARTPLRIEAVGSMLHIAVAIALSEIVGLPALALGALAGTGVTAFLLARRTPLRRRAVGTMLRATGAGAASVAVCLGIEALQPRDWQLLLQACLAGGMASAAGLVMLRPWRREPHQMGDLRRP